MKKFLTYVFLSLLFPVLLFSFDMKSFQNSIEDSIVGKGGEKMLDAMGTSMQATSNIIDTTVELIEPSSKETRKIEKELSPEEREAFLQKQFASKEDIFNTKVKPEEKINVDVEVASFFNSLNSEDREPVNIE